MILPILLLAQITAMQLAIPPAPPDAIRLLGVVGDRFHLVSMGTGVVIISDLSGMRLEASGAVPVAPIVPKLVQTPARRLADGTYTGHVANGVVLRNGVLQQSPDDYTVAGAVITPKPAWAVDDAVTVLWIAVAPLSLALPPVVGVVRP